MNIFKEFFGEGKFQFLILLFLSFFVCAILYEYREYLIYLIYMLCVLLVLSVILLVALYLSYITLLFFSKIIKKSF